MIEQIILNEQDNFRAISEAFRLITSEDGLEATPETLLTMAVWILLEEGFDVTVDRVRIIAAKRCIGLDAEEAIEAIIEDDALMLIAGRIELVDSNREVAL